MNDANSVLIGIIIICSVLIVVGGVIYLISRAVKKQRKKEVAEEEANGTETLKKGESGERVMQGLSFQYKHFRGTDKAPPSFSMTLQCTANGAFSIRKENKFDRFFKRMNVCVEIETHDKEFDDTYFISTNKIIFSRSFLERRENRESIKALFALGFNLLKYDGTKIVVVWQSYPRRKRVEISLMEQAAPHLASLNHNLQKMPEYQHEESTTWKTKRLATFATTTIVLIGGITSLIIGMSNYKPLDSGKVFSNSLLFSLPLLTLFTFLAINLLKGRSTSHWELMAVFLISLFAFPLAGFGVNTMLNGALDEASASIHTMPVVKKFYRKNKSSKSYYVRVKSWREGRRTEKLKISRRYYNTLSVGTSMISITTKPGKYGYEWLKGFE